MHIAVYEEFHRYLHVEMKTFGKSSVIIKYSPHVRVSIEWSGVTKVTTIMSMFC